jgi:formylglycine-generating enzyme required for sulfatase activity/tRNA A-37 threonylcarbamoyl transferase component Bud32
MTEHDPQTSDEDLAFALDLSGQVLDGRYRVREVLGEGGMGTVYLAHDERMDRDVVVKVPHPRLLAEKGFRERFQKEIRALTSLEQANLVKAVDAGRVRGVPYAVLQYLGGGSLKERIAAAGGRLSPEEVLEWLPAIARALDFIHAQGVVHRDVKPGNVLFDRAGNVHLADFGIAKALATADSGLTATGMTPGSPDYMAPEQVTGGVLTGAVDQYALASLLYEALCGEVPFRGQTPLAVLFQKQTVAPPPLAERAANVPPGAAAAVMRGLAKEPAARFATCRELAEAFQRGLTAPVTRAEPRAPSRPAAPPAAARPQAARRAAGPRWGRIALVGCVLLAGAGFGLRALGVFGGGGGERPTPPAPAADTTPPRLEVLDPAQESATVPTELVRLRGRATDEALLEVTADGRGVPVARDGTFEVPVALEEGKETVVSLEAVDRAGNRTGPVVRRIRYQRPVAAWEGALDEAQRAGRAQEWERAKEALARAKAADAPGVSIPAWLTEGIHAYDAAPTLTVTEPTGPVTVGVGKALTVKGTLRTGRKSDRVFLQPGGEAVLKDGAFEGTATFQAPGEQRVVLEVRDGATVRAGTQVSVSVVRPAPAEAAVPSWAKVSAEQLEEARRLGVGVAFENALGMRFVLVPAGEFEMGSPEGEKDRGPDERQHRVRLMQAYYVQVTEVTNDQYRRFKPDHDSGTFGNSLNGGTQPVVNVSHDDVVAFAAWVSQQDRGRSYELPTEAQWEHAARAGTKGSRYWGEEDGEAFRYANANDPVTKAKFKFSWDAFPKDDGHRLTAPVGSYLANAWGLHDVLGNVWEWVSDWYGKYPAGPVTNPTGPASGDERVLRGGSWAYDPGPVRAAGRFYRVPAYRYGDIGFRLVAALPRGN